MGYADGSAGYTRALRGNLVLDGGFQALLGLWYGRAAHVEKIMLCNPADATNTIEIWEKESRQSRCTRRHTTPSKTKQTKVRKTELMLKRGVRGVYAGIRAGYTRGVREGYAAMRKSLFLQSAGKTTFPEKGIREGYTRSFLGRSFFI